MTCPHVFASKIPALAQTVQRFHTQGHVILRGTMVDSVKPTGRRWSSPEMAKIAATALIKHSFNATRAAKELRPHLTEQSARKTGSRMMKTEAVLEELENQLAPFGLDEGSRDRYLKVLWTWFLGNDKELKQTAARIFGRGFVTQKLEVEKPATLLISGFEEGVKKMLGDPQQDSAEEPNEEPVS